MDYAKLKSQILSILFVSTKPVSISELEESLAVGAEEIREAVSQIVSSNHSSGIILLANNDKLVLSSNPENSPAVKKFLSLELREKLTDAALETLAVIAYRQPVSKAEVENIRGVNSQYTIRHLLIRGLIEKTGSTTDKRVQLYRVTHEFMQHMGLKDLKDLPDFEELTKSIQIADPSTLASPQPHPEPQNPSDKSF